ncbi:MAG: spore germination protein [Bacillota bacterium]
MAGNIWRTLLSLLSNNQNKFPHPGASPKGTVKLSTDLTTNISNFKEALGNSMDVEIRVLFMGKTQVAMVYIDSIVDRTALRENAIKALMVDSHTAGLLPGYGSKGLAHAAKGKVVSVCCVKESKDLHKLIDAVLSANIVVLFDGDDTGLILKLPGYETRSVTEPQTESVIRGSREGFTESISTNISMIRRRIKDHNLRMERLRLGRVTKTEICIAYIKGIVDPKTVEEVKKRLHRIELDGVLESGYIEEFIQDAPYSVFPTVGNAEKPDKVAAQLLEGRVAIITDGTPFVLTVPYLFIESLQSSEDYYSRFLSSSFFRILRFTFLVISTNLPAMYVSISSFNPEIMPTSLLLILEASRKGVFLPPIGEVLLMGLIFEGLREAGVRLPRNVGQAISIVGALVIGQAAVSAGLISAPTVIVTALTGIASFISPSQSEAQLLIRIFYTLVAGFLGFFGLFMGNILVIMHMASLRSFRVPYLSPLAPLWHGDLKDSLVRAPWWFMTNRPRLNGLQNIRRAGITKPPGPAGGEEEMG